MAIKLFAVHSKIMLVDKCVPRFCSLYYNRFEAIFESSYLWAIICSLLATTSHFILNGMINTNNKIRNKN